MEPDTDKHHIFDTFAEAMQAWMLMPEELQEQIASPRQSHGCWIFDKEPKEWQ